MTMTEATERNWLRGKQLALALFATSVALAGGAQALTPAPAAAMISEGEECDSSYPSIDCENTGGGGGGESGGGTAGAGGGDVGEIVGPVEVIEVEGKAPEETAAPSPCGKNCLPSQLGGRHGPGGDGIGQKSPGRHGGKPTRVAQAPAKAKEANGDPSLEQCKKFVSNRIDLPIDKKIQKYADILESLEERIQALYRQRDSLQSERMRLERLGSRTSAAIVGLAAAIGSVENEIFPLRTRSFEVSRKYSQLVDQAGDEFNALGRACKDRFPGLRPD